MSEAAILRRLKTVDQLRELCLSLMKAKKVSDEKSEKGKKKSRQSRKNCNII
jgi:ribosomal protein S21